MGGFDPKKMQGLMKQMGIKQDEIDAVKVKLRLLIKKLFLIIQMWLRFLCRAMTRGK